MRKSIPENELEFAQARSSGPGGQNVNKTNTKVTVRWKVGASRAFSDEEKARLRQVLSNRLSQADELIVSASDERSQFSNRRRAVSRLQALVARALAPRKKRRPTRPTAGSRQRSLESKSQRSKLKQRRRGLDGL